MAEQIAPTRSNLLQRRDQLRLAIRGADLLKRKRDALIGEFFDLVKVSLEARRKLGATSKEAYFSLFLAKAWDGPEAVESLSLAQQGELEVEIEVQNLFGVKVPEVQPPEFSDELPFSPVNTGAKTLDAAAEFKRLTEALVQVAATETRLRRIGEEIKKTSRRVNALEQLVIPGINSQIKDIRSVLDQRALEEVTVLKRIKAKLEARAAEEAESSVAEPYPGNTTTNATTAKRIENTATALAPGQTDAGASSGIVTAEKVEAVATADATTSEASSPSDVSAAQETSVTSEVASADSAGEASVAAEVDTPVGNGSSLDIASYVEDVAKYTDSVDEDVVKGILESFGEAVNDRDAMIVACGQQKELSFIKKKFLKGKLNLLETNRVLDLAMQEVCEKMGRSNRNKSSVTFYYLLVEKFDKFSVYK